MPKDLDEFQAVSKRGKRLAEMHLNYESAKPFEDLEIEKSADFDERNPECFEVEKMKYGGKPGAWDKTILRYNRFLTMRRIPMECHNYRLGARSALDWLVNRYRIKTDKRSQITRNPNKWIDGSDASDSGGKYIFNLIPKIITISLQTMKIAK